MDINLFTNTSDDRKVNKSLTAIATASCNVKGDCSIHKPSLILDSIDDSVMAVVNYLYIPAWKRYYFINEVVALTGGRIQINARVDVLMSYKKGIQNTVCLVTRQEHIFNEFITDDRLQYRKGRIQTVKKLADIDTTKRNYYLTTIRGGGNA